jgi:molecular chaperone HtpG
MPAKVNAEAASILSHTQVNLKMLDCDWGRHIYDARRKHESRHESRAGSEQRFHRELIVANKSKQGIAPVKKRTAPSPVDAEGSHAFQVNLAGVIELLSAHLYSGPHVYLRELLQNAVDAISARRQLAKSPPGEITVELVEDSAGGAATLIFEDNGIGLTEEEVHRFLATIGSSSKRGELPGVQNDFIGQFGIGLLSGFMVSDEIVMITRSVKGGQPVLEWSGQANGRYSLRTLPDSEAKPGTKVFLRARVAAGEYFKSEYIRHHLENFGGFLQPRLDFIQGSERVTLNAERAPWDELDLPPAAWRSRCLDYGEKLFNVRFLDCFMLAVPETGIQGIAFVLPESPSLAARRSDRVYLKRMLLSERADGLLPEWAFFVRCVINTTGLKPNASREAFQEDAAFDRAKSGLAKCLREYLVDLARRDQQRLQKLISIHNRAIKVLASDDEEFYRLFIDWLPFETSQGQLPMGKIRLANEEVLYVPNIDTFRQLSAVAAAQALCLINAGYSCDVDLIERLPEVFPELSVRQVGPGDLLDAMEEVPASERIPIEASLESVSDTLNQFGCDLEIRCFRPAELSAMYSLDEQARFFRDVQRSREQSNPLFQNLLDGIAPGADADTRGCLCMNWRNPLVRKLLALPPGEILSRATEMLYVQALLQGHFPLGAAEHQLLGGGLTRLLELAVQSKP